MQVGDIVKITEGPLVGSVARFVRMVERRALIILELPDRRINVELDADWIVASAPERKSASGVEAPAPNRQRHGS